LSTNSDNQRGLRFAKRTYAPRIIGLGLGALCVATVLYQRQASFLLWALLLINGYVWPHLAWWKLARRSANPYRAEIRNLMVDSLLGGFWVPAMAFNLLPSVIIISMLGMNNIGIGGQRLMLKGLVAQLIGALCALLLLGIDVHFSSTTSNVLGCLPMLIVYPLCIGMVNYRLSSKLGRQKADLERLSRTDGLSQLNSRGYWEELTANEFLRARRHSHPAALLLIDMDHFKQVNDRHGHIAGDEVIKTMALTIVAGLRQTDMAGRYGGDEFGVILPDTSADGAMRIAEKLRRRVAATAMHSVKPISLTISIGVAQLDADSKDYFDWLDQADRALYQAKQRGRNRSILAKTA
jgi:diguanylate cyclase